MAEARKRTYTEKTLRNFADKQNKFREKISALCDEGLALIDNIKRFSNNRTALENIQTELTDVASKYEYVCKEYLEFLLRIRTEDSLVEHSRASNQFKLFNEDFAGVLENLATKLSRWQHDVRPETEQEEMHVLPRPVFHEESPARRPTQHSPSNPIPQQDVADDRTASNDSQRSSIVARARARVEAAKVRSEYMEKEVRLLKQKALLEEKQAIERAKAEREKADLDADLSLLVSRREKAAIEAEADVLHSELDDNPSRRSCLSVQPPLDAKNKTAAYIEHVNKQAEGSNTNRQELNPSAPPYIPYVHTVCNTLDDPNRDYAMNQQEYHTAADLTRFLLKKDLLFSRFTVFGDKAELYPSWKASFRSIITEIQANASEEIDLLIRWTGPQSQSHVQSLKAANPSDPEKAKRLIWERLDERFGSPELIDATLKNKLATFPRITYRDYHRLYDLSDILAEVVSIKENDMYRTMFSYFDSSVGVIPIASKLPYQLQERWTSTAVDYNRKHGTVYPPFQVFANFIKDQSKIRNNPSFVYEEDATAKPKKDKGTSRTREIEARARKTDSATVDLEPSEVCPLHNAKHPLNNCKAFRSKPLSERKKLIKQKRICFRCCASTKHFSKDCSADVKCNECGSSSHPTALHIKDREQKANWEGKYGGEQNGTYECRQENTPEVSTRRTQTSLTSFQGKSCAKIVLVNAFRENEPQNIIKVYAMIDDQSNMTLAKTELFDFFGSTGVTNYVLSTCSGRSHTQGRQLDGLIVESLDHRSQIRLENILECDQIPDVVHEIPTPEVIDKYPHLADLKPHIPPLDHQAKILLLISRDAIRAHHVLDQRIGLGNAPYAQKLPLGWTIIGETCLGHVHCPATSYVKKTFLHKGDRVSLFEPCSSDISISRVSVCTSSFAPEKFGSTVFLKTPDDDKPGLSRDDRDFLNIMSKSFHKDEDGMWAAPLPFRKNRQVLPNNRCQALRRAKCLDVSLKKNEAKKQHFLRFMEAIFENGHAELAKELSTNCERWYLPIFAVYHPKKPDSLRAVFDSSAKFENVSLNDVLLTGPDLSNNLLGVLLRFRQEQVAVMADIQQMFYCFKVVPEHRDYLRFLWFENNIFGRPLQEYRMTVHVFGNSPSPAIATYGLRKAALGCASSHGHDVLDFVENNFYVDDGLISLPTASDAISLLKRTQAALESNGNLRLHKIASNSETVMSAFTPGDLAKGLQDLDLESSELPTQRSLGMKWDLESDCFMFNISSEIKPYTRRGILSTINSVYDPLGYLAPVLIKGKLLLRTLMAETVDWNEPLSPEYYDEWETWKLSLHHLESCKFPRMMSPDLVERPKKTVHIFCDASESAIAAVAHLHSESESNHVAGFMMGKAKLAPKHGHTTPRLELCAAVLATELGQFISEQLGFPLPEIKYHSDSKVVLGYICNSSRRFYTYVSNRVAKIISLSDPSQWCYVSTKRNPADVATRSIHPKELQDSLWITGYPRVTSDHHDKKIYNLQSPDADPEVRPKTIVCMATNLRFKIALGSQRFERFSSWKSLVNAIGTLKCFIQAKKGNRGHKLEPLQITCEKIIIRIVQLEVFREEIIMLESNKPVSKESPIWKLDPFIDDDGLLRVGGRLKNAKISEKERSPILIPRQNWIATLLVRHFHTQIKHQGRHFTAGAIRTGGYWIIGSKRLVSSILYNCVPCRKLRRVVECQKMADLPLDRLQPCPPFTNVGIDTFGPWTIVTRRTRGGAANSKRWAIMFTCMSTRGVHIEVVEDMSSNSFINAFKRFAAIRGAVKQVRSDRGTNFVGALDALGVQAINVEDGPVRDYLYNNNIVWLFNSPNSSHMGGSWERMIGITRRILDAMMAEFSTKDLTHEVLTTLLAEVSTIINSRPLTAVSTDPEEPYSLSPSMILTQKPDVLVPNVSFECKDMLRAQWKRVQYLADVFWHRWRNEFLQSLQERRKWTVNRKNIEVGDVVLFKDKSVDRLHWPMGLVTAVFPSADDLVRKVEVKVARRAERQNVKTATFIRPVTELVLLLAKHE